RRQFQRLLPGPGGVVEAGADVADVRGEAASRVVERTRGEYEAAVDAVEGVEDRLHRRQAVVGAGAVERGQALRPRFGDQLADEVVAEAADRAGGRGERRAERRRSRCGQRVEGGDEGSHGDARGLAGGEHAEQDVFG